MNHATRNTILTLLIIICGLQATLTTTTATAGTSSGCPNEQLRTGYSAALPDCRAYELVSADAQPFFETFSGEHPPAQNITYGVSVVGAELGTTAAQSSTDSGLSFFSTFAPPGSTTDGPYYLASRGPTGWTTRNLIPRQSTEVGSACLPYMVGWSTNLGRGILADGFRDEARACGADEPELVPGEPRGMQNLFLRDTSTGGYQLIDTPPLSGAFPGAFYQAGSSDLGVVVFDEEAVLTSEAPVAALDFYVWAGGQDRLLTILPDGVATTGELADAALPNTVAKPFKLSPAFTHPVAPDGSKIEFAANGNLYARERPGESQSALDGEGDCDESAKACTVQIDASETAEPGGGGRFAGTSGETGDVVYFSDPNRLTSDATATTEEPDLYAYDFRRSVGDRLTDLTIDGNPGEHAGVLGYVGSNETGAPGGYIYFVAKGVLAENRNNVGSSAAAGAPNLYVSHAGAISFIATLGLEDMCDWENRCMTARVSANGAYIGFDSLQQLTGFNNVDANTSIADQEIFLYSTGAAKLSCASCTTTGLAPTAPASIRLPEGVSAFPPTPLTLQRNVSDNGQVFFDSEAALIDGARNGQSNVYEYEGEHLDLLSSGVSESPSYFYDASTDGSDAYFITGQALFPGADPAELAVYDAKVDGGFPVPSPGTEPCAGEGCSGVQSIASRLPAISSASISGQGNLEPVASKPATVRSLTNAQKLAKALRSCRAKRNRHKRGVCEVQARKRYGPHSKKSAKTNRRGK
jgi:hypothetical protein